MVSWWSDQHPAELLDELLMDFDGFLMPQRRLLKEPDAFLMVAAFQTSPVGSDLDGCSPPDFPGGFRP